MQRNALIYRLDRHLRLTPGERSALEWPGRHERRVRAGTKLVSEGEPNDRLFVVQHGWLHSARTLAAGRRQILAFHYAGDLIGTSSIAWAQAATTITAIEDCIVQDLPKSMLGRLFAEHPRLGGIFYAIAAAEAVAASDRLTSVGRMNAEDRLALLLLDMLARLRVTAGGVVDGFDLPLTQTDLGDALGLTKVHVNRTLRAMERQGWIVRAGKRIRLLDEVGLIARTGFIDRHAEIDTSWLPPASAASFALTG